MRYLISLWIALSLSMIASTASADDASHFKITSPATAENGPLPVLYTCDGKNISPNITWSGKPAGTRSLALVVTDPDAPGGTFYHWLLFNLPTQITTLDEGIDLLPKPAQVGTNSFGKVAYSGPCPPRHTNHHYVFTLYALDKKLNLATGVEGAPLLKAINQHTLDKTTFVAVYTRWVGQF